MAYDIAALELEKQVLGSLLNRDRFFSVDLQEDDFSSLSHQTIFRAIARRAAAGSGMDIPLLIDDLREHGELERAGDVVYILSVLQEGFPAPSLEEAARRLRDYATRRKLLDIQTFIQQRTGQLEEPVENVLEDIQRQVLELSCHQGRQVKTMRELLDDYREHKKAVRDGRIFRLSTGYPSLDGLLDGGFERGQFIVIAARSNMGKTALALRIAANMAECGKCPLFLSMESTANKLIDRLIASKAGISASELQTREGLARNWDAFGGALAAMANTRLVLDVRDSARVSDISIRARQLQAEGRLDAVFIDYLQLIRPRAGERSSAPREQVIAGIADDLLSLAHRLDVPVIALAQTNRATESRQDKRPILADIRESDRIAQNADIVLSLHREEYYLREQTPPHKRGITDILVLKNRDGRMGTAYLNFMPETVDFFELSDGQRAKIGGLPLNDKGEEVLAMKPRKRDLERAKIERAFDGSAIENQANLVDMADYLDMKKSQVKSLFKEYGGFVVDDNEVVTREPFSTFRENGKEPGKEGGS